MEERIRFVQEELRSRDRFSGEITGVINNTLRRALKTVIGLPHDWSSRKKVHGVIQLLGNAQGLELDVDGLWGPQTSSALDFLREKRINSELSADWRDEKEASESPVITPKPKVIFNEWPRESEKELIKHYGKIGENQTRLQFPYPHVLSYDTSKKVKSTRCHEKVHNSIERIMNRVLDHYGLEKIEALRLNHFGGCLNVRKIRGGDRYSTHSWGIALDFDTQNNRLRWGKDRATLARPEYNMWWKFWEEEGWISIGRLRNYDWMHVQAACR